MPQGTLRLVPQMGDFPSLFILFGCFRPSFSETSFHVTPDLGVRHCVTTPGQHGDTLDSANHFRLTVQNLTISHPSLGPFNHGNGML